MKFEKERGDVKEAFYRIGMQTQIVRKKEGEGARKRVREGKKDSKGIKERERREKEREIWEKERERWGERKREMGSKKGEMKKRLLIK